VQHCLIYHSFFDGNMWSTPLAINDTTYVKVPDRAAPRIAIDRQGSLHVCFTGVAAGAGSRDIFYTRRSGNVWSPATIVTRDGIYNEWYSDIAVGDSNNVWVVWERQGESSDQFRIHASHFDGVNWSPETRLDGNLAHYDCNARVRLDLDGNPWVVWNGETDSGPDLCDIYFNRLLAADVNEERAGQRSGQSPPLTARVGPGSSVQFAYYVETPGDVGLTVLDELGRRIWSRTERNQGVGARTVEWNRLDSRGKGVPSGTYFCRLEKVRTDETCRFLLISMNQ
jgi:hypothetical protein